jgi:hypothetical protein
MPIQSHVAKNGIRIKFSTDLDGATAQDASSYAVEVWNYRYSGGYGSPELSVKEPGKQAHDRLEVKSARLAADKRTLFLEIPGLTEADQYSVRYSISAADGTELRSEIIGTIHKVGPEEPLASR